MACALFYLSKPTYRQTHPDTNRLDAKVIKSARVWSSKTHILHTTDNNLQSVCGHTDHIKYCPVNQVVIVQCALLFMCHASGHKEARVWMAVGVGERGGCCNISPFQVHNMARGHISTCLQGDRRRTIPCWISLKGLMKNGALNVCLLLSLLYHISSYIVTQLHWQATSDLGILNQCDLLVSQGLLDSTLTFYKEMKGPQGHQCRAGVLR